MNQRYKIEVSNIIREGLQSFISTGNPDELEFRLWLGARKHYYQFRFENNIISKHLKTKAEVLLALQDEVDKVKETTYQTLKPLQPEAEIINIANKEN